MRSEYRLNQPCDPLRKLLPLGVLVCAVFCAAPAQGSGGANILIVSENDSNNLARDSATQLTADLGGTNTVTTVTVTHSAPLTGPLTGYTQIFDVRYNNTTSGIYDGFTSAEMQLYLTFLNAAPGNTLFLMGENVSFLTRNNAISAFIALAGGGAVAAPTANSHVTETVNPPFTGPNAISSLTYNQCGLVTSAGTGAFATQEAPGGGVGGCAIYFGLGTLAQAPHGALVIVYDVNFIGSPGGGVNENSFRLNLEQFSLSPTTPPTVTAVSPGSGAPAGGTTISITGTGFLMPATVTVGGVAATNVSVVSATTIMATTPAGTARAASVTVADPNGVSAANSLYSYATIAPVLQISFQGPINLQVVQNQSLLASGASALMANQGGYSWQASTTTAWLTLNLPTGAFPGAVQVTANATGLAAGAYNGSVTVTSGALTLQIPVTLTVLPPASIMTTPAALSVAASYPTGSATGYTIQIGPAGLPFTAQTSSTSASWLKISPTSGNGPSTINVVIDPGKATPGVFQDSIVVTSPGAPNSPLTIPVKLAVSTFIATLPQLTNSATGAGPDHTLGLNEIVTLMIPDVACASQPKVSINGTAVAWSSYAAGQINYAVPATVTQPAVLSLACNGITIWSFNGLNVAATVPGIFTISATGSGQAAEINSDTTINSPTNAAARGSYISLYVTGFGVFDAASADGLRRLDGTVTAQIGGVSATVLYAGEAPGNTDGLQQINLVVPTGSPVGSAVPVLLRVNGTPTQTTATIAVK